MHMIGQLRTLNQVQFDPDTDESDIDFDALEQKLIQFCEGHMRNPRSKELDELVQSCRREE